MDLIVLFLLQTTAHFACHNISWRFHELLLQSFLPMYIYLRKQHEPSYLERRYPFDHPAWSLVLRLRPDIFFLLSFWDRVTWYYGQREAFLSKFFECCSFFRPFCSLVQLLTF
jgi:hypothetical protein